MIFRQRRTLAAVTALTLLTGVGSTAQADSMTITTPNISNAAGPQSASLDGKVFVNQGLVAVARLPADGLDFNGETLGSFSGMAIDLKTWRRTADGGYAATLYTLPDRGPNGVGGLTTTDYAARLNRFAITFKPSAANGQLALTPDGGFLLKDATGERFTGREPRSQPMMRDGLAYPTPAAGDAGAGKISIDPEAVTFRPNGGFYVGDEYGATIYAFDKTGRQVGAIQATPAILPKMAGAPNFTADDKARKPGATGRRANQGMEGLSVSPDGTRLFAVLQSATLQDTVDDAAQNRNNTRVLVYDISRAATPKTPIAEYVLQLPTYRNGAKGDADKTAAQSEVLALNNSQFLVLARDSNGRGSGSAKPDLFKSVLLADIDGATNIAGTAYETSAAPIVSSANASGAVLNPAIKPVRTIEVVNLLNPVQLARFGINLANGPSNPMTLSEKWESLAIAPALDPAHPRDVFLFVGNDNDFMTGHLNAAGIKDASTALTDAASGVGENDNVILVYRLTLPTYAPAKHRP